MQVYREVNLFNYPLAFFGKWINIIRLFYVKVLIESVAENTMLFLKLIYHGLKDHFAVAGSDPRTSDLPFVGSYIQILILMIGYAVMATKIGPAIMAKRKAYSLKMPITIYNIGQILLNAYIFYGLTKYYVGHPNFNLACMGTDTSDNTPATMRILPFTYLYFVSKILDIFDTIFFVLRKKFNQVSFLHVYHHTVMIWAAFVYHNLLFGSMFTTIGYVNSFIHVVMYTYYLASAHNMNFNLEVWKPRMTQLQILQFCYFTIKFGAALIISCKASTFWLNALFLQNLFMTAMFSNFYYKSYIVKQRKNKSLK